MTRVDVTGWTMYRIERWFYGWAVEREGNKTFVVRRFDG